jgi:anti-sigma factor RsiW
LLTCKEFLDGLTDYLDGTLEGEIRQHLETHITECPNCWVIVDTTKKTIQIYKGMDPQPISPELHSRLMQALEKKMSGSAGRT